MNATALIQLLLCVLFVSGVQAQWNEYIHKSVHQKDYQTVNVTYINEDTLILTENFNEIFVSVDGGVSFKKVLRGSPFSGHWCRAVHFDPETQRIWVGCERDQIWVSDDYGQTWKDVWPFHLTTMFNSIYAFNRDRIFFADELSGFGFYSVSDENFTFVNDRLLYPDSGRISMDKAYQVDFVNDSVVYLVQDDDYSNDWPDIYRSENGGLTWQYVAGEHPSSYNDKRIYIVQFLNEQVGYGVSKWWRNLYKTTDGGKTWKLVLDVSGEIAGVLGLTDNNLECFDFVNEDFGMVVTFDEIYRTKDGGKTWEVVSPKIRHYDRSFHGVDCYNEDTCVAFGFGNYSLYAPGYKAFWRTTNGGGPGTPLSTKAIGTKATTATLWPVPTSGQTQLRLSGYTGAILIRVQDMAGRWVYAATTEAPQLTLPSAQWPAGMYLVHIIADDEPTKVLKLVRQ